MVMIMNKEQFVNELSNKINYSIDKCRVILDILESNFFISKKNKGKIIDEITYRLEIETKEAEIIYEVATKIIKEEIIHKLKHPFGSQN